MWKTLLPAARLPSAALFHRRHDAPAPLPQLPNSSVTSFQLLRRAGGRRSLSSWMAGALQWLETTAWDSRPERVWQQSRTGSR